MKRWTLPLLIALGSLCFGLFFAAVFVNSTELDCVRQSDGTYSCHKRTLFFDRWQISERDFDGVQDIVMVDDGCDDGCSYRAEFVTASGRYIPLSTVYTDRGIVDRQVTEIGSQLDRGAQSIRYKANPPWWVLYLIGGLTLMAMVMGGLFTRPASTK